MKDRERDDRDALDATCDRMRKHLPIQPYIQTVPQDEPRYHHHNAHYAEMWLKDAPFNRREHPSLQYQTWFYQEHGTDLIHLRIHSQIENTSSADAKARDEATKTAASTPNPSAGPKKKISLAAYKDKKVNGTAGTSGTDVAVPSRDDAQSNRQDLDRNGVKREDMASKQREAQKEGNATLKRKRALEEDKECSASRPSEPSSATKRPRPSSPESQHNTTSPRSSQQVANKRKHQDKDEDLPERLSPLRMPLPGRLSPLELQLPDRLSPTLPADIVAELERRAKNRAASDSSNEPVKRVDERSGSKHDSVTSNSMSHDSVADEEYDAGSKKSASSSENNRAKERERMTDGGSKGKLAEASERDSEQDRPTDATENSTKAASESSKRQKLIVRLKIPKRLRPSYKALLRFPPKPSKAHAERPIDNDLPDTVASKSKKSLPSAESHERPHTPVQQPLPFPSPPSAQKGFQNTPGNRKEKDLRTSVVSRGMDPPSSDHVQQPQPNTSSPAPTSQTPAPATNTTTNIRPSPGSSTSTGPLKTPQSQAWWAEKERLAALGKTLKRNAADLSSSSSSSKQTSQQQQQPANAAELAALTNIESLLSFILSFAANDASYAARRPPVTAPDPRQTWCTLHGFWRFVHSVAAPWPVLQALVSGLGEVYCARILSWCAGYNGGSNGGGGGARSEEHEVVLVLAKIAGCKSAGGVKMGDWRREFPEAWRRGVEKGLSAAGEGGEADGNDGARPGSYDGAFELPVGLQTSPIPAVRACVAVLAEWRVGGRRGEKYVPKLKLRRE